MTLLQRQSAAFRALGYLVCLVGLGTSKGARKYTSHLGWTGRIVVDPDLSTYKAMGWDDNSGLAAAATSSEAAARMKECADCPAPTMILFGSGLLRAGQNGGYVAVTSDGEHVPFAFRQSEAGDMPPVEVVLEALRK